MANLLVKLEELSKKLDDFDTNIYQNTDINNLDMLKFKNKHGYKENANDIRPNESKSSGSDTLFKTQLLKEPNQNHVNEFEFFKQYTANRDINQIDTKNVNEFLLYLKDEIDQMKNDVSSGRYNENKKAHALIKLQTLGTLITCHIINLDNNL